MTPPAGPVTFHIETERFLFRTLTPADASERWCQWLLDPHAALMLNAPRQRLTLEQLRAYIAGFDQIERLLCGLFERKTGQHFGIITGEYIDGGRRIMPSALIGEPEYRNIGALTELRDQLGPQLMAKLSFEAAVASVLAHNTIMISILEARGWKLIRRLRSEKKRADGQGFVDLLLYELRRETWFEQRKASGLD